MRVILAGIVLALVFAALAGIGYSAAQRPVYEAQPMPSVRVGDPGSNLVGQNWSGHPKLQGPEKPRGADPARGAT
jgi:hypothetical protein